MQLVAGTRLGPYEIVSAAGSGGMGEVYRARDSRLDREVAVKILPPHLADTAEARQRFEREARAISKLSHPHICALYDVGRHESFDFLVLEFLEGETLASRLDRGPLSLGELLRFGGQVASALDAAHRRNIVHRDLKPGNVILTATGAKLLDFGLAKGAALASSQSELSATPTESRPLTAEGSVVGTVQYMAPEQLEGREADARTDIFALGLVLYQMATGAHAFEGRTPASLIAAILKDEPSPLAERASGIPRALDRIVGTCLTKDPEARWQSARDVEIQLKALGGGDEEESLVSSKPRTRERLAWAAALLFLAVVAINGFLRNRADSGPAPMVRSSLMPPSGLSFVPENFAMSPDGTRLAFVAVGASGRSALWVRALSAASAQELNGAEGATYPFWAPDSGAIGFFAAGKLKTADLATGEVRELCDAPLGRGGTWNREDTIVFAPSVAGPLLQVSASGGTPAPATRLPRPDSAGAHRWPYFLPDGKHFFYFVDWTDSFENGLYIGSLDAAEGKLISAEVTGNAAFASGRLLYVQDRRLMAQPFDLPRLETRGPPVPLGEQELEKDLAFFRAGFSVSDDGLLVFQSAREAPSRLVWYDENGEELGEVPAERLRDPRISPDGRFLAVSSDDLGNGKRFIRVFDLARGVSTSLTSGGNEEAPVWSRDGREITYVSSGINTFSMERIPVDGPGPAQLILKGARMIPNDRAPDGRLVFMSFESGPASMRVYSPEDGQVSAFGLGGEAQFSPDGKWIAHVMGAPRGGLFVQPFPGPGARIQITGAGGTQARWSRDGKRIFYITPDKKLMAVDFDSQTQTAGAPRQLFQTRIVGTSFVLFQYDVAPDGRFLINSFPAERSSPLTLVTNWPRQLER